MFIKKIKIKNFRIIKNLELDLNKNINIFIGDNAQGKTSILESIYLLALTKSFRNIEDVDLINKNEEFAKIAGIISNDRNDKNLEIILQKNNKTLKIDKIDTKKVSNYISNLNVIMFNPEDLDIIKKSPIIRRNLINIELCQLFPNYMKLLNEYNKLLKMRNEYLRKNHDSINKTYLEALTDKFIDRALVIMDYREKIINNINANIDTVYYKIMKEHGLRVEYEKSINIIEKEKIKQLFSDNFLNEINKKMTLFGPHRDDIVFYHKEDNLKIYGSQGQQRSAILSFKLSEINLFKETKGYYPVVLLDDIFSEIDIEKRTNLLKFIKSNIQFIITTTDINNISEKVLNKSNIFHVKNGTVEREGKI